MSAPDAGFEFQEHTADVKLHVWGDTLAALFQAAATGFYRLIGELVSTDVGETVTIELQAPDATDLLHDWLAELLFRFDTRHLHISEIEFAQISDAYLSATGQGRRVDLERSRFDSEIKAVTYHGLEVKQRRGRYEATVILDL
ncbi:MAG: archease [Phycisphaerales bacterium]|nr:MAG: archease [Phycisphaerales bacterium]